MNKDEEDNLRDCIEPVVIENKLPDKHVGYNVGAVGMGGAYIFGKWMYNHYAKKNMEDKDEN